jgi:hypothetical protein
VTVSKVCKSFPHGIHDVGEALSDHPCTRIPHSLNVLLPDKNLVAKSCNHGFLPCFQASVHHVPESLHPLKDMLGVELERYVVHTVLDPVDGMLRIHVRVESVDDVPVERLSA